MRDTTDACATKDVEIKKEHALSNLKRFALYARLVIFSPNVPTTYSNLERNKFFLPIIRMRHLAAYLLAAISDNEVPSETKISNILGSVGVEADEKQIKTVIERFAGKTPSKVIAEVEKCILIVIRHLSCMS
ncbi:60S acidic ribosomal protein P2 [Armadillidium vulgare]|nr:60S acidic ribosomal protein P2 [Armadillidium vulgare]